MALNVGKVMLNVELIDQRVATFLDVSVGSRAPVTATGVPRQPLLYQRKSGEQGVNDYSTPQKAADLQRSGMSKWAIAHREKQFSPPSIAEIQGLDCPNFPPKSSRDLGGAACAVTAAVRECAEIWRGLRTVPELNVASRRWKRIGFLHPTASRSRGKVNLPAPLWHGVVKSLFASLAMSPG